MKRTVKLLLLGVCIAALAGCGKKEEETQPTAAQNIEIEIGDQREQEEQEEQEDTAASKDMYQFQDVLENSYEAELLADVPKCTYDFANLRDENGYKYYTDGDVTSRIGIDVSEFQGEVDWQQVKDSGIEFVIVRLGYRAYGDSGALVMDAMFDQNMQGAIDAGLDVGVYFFSQAISEAEAEEEANFVLEHIQPYNVQAPVVFDTEEIKGDTARTDNNTPTDFTDYCITFCDKIKDAGYDTMIYANMKWMAFTLELDRLTEYDFWYADYHDIPQCPYDYKMWQYTESGTVPGIAANVDLNVWFQED